MHPGMWYIDKQTKIFYDFMIYTFNRVFDVLRALKRVSVDFIECAKISRKNELFTMPKNIIMTL